MNDVSFGQQRMFHFAALLVAAAGFALYAVSSMVLQARSATLFFGADANLYALIAEGKVLDRIARFHPVTTLLAESWMFLLKPFAGIISPQQWLKLFFSMVGAAGVWASTVALAMLVPRPFALLGGTLYALTLSVWYFSSIEESKIVSAALAVLYVAIWLRLREKWSTRGAFLLTLTLFAACLNEIVACFLVSIPFVDELLRRRLHFRKLLWIAVHALAAPVALALLELAVPEGMARSADLEGKSHFSMLLYYLSKNDYGLASLYSVLLNWFSFSAISPVTKLNFCQGCWVYFEPVFQNYFVSFWTAAPLLLLVVMTAAMLLPACRPMIPPAMRAILLALAAYSLLRGAFFFLFNSFETMLYTAPVMLPHIALFIVPFSASGVPAKYLLLGILAVLLFIGNGLFIMGL